MMKNYWRYLSQQATYTQWMLLADLLFAVAGLGLSLFSYFYLSAQMWSAVWIWLTTVIAFFIPSLLGHVAFYCYLKKCHFNDNNLGDSL